MPDGYWAYQRSLRRQASGGRQSSSSTPTWNRTHSATQKAEAAGPPLSPVLAVLAAGVVVLIFSLGLALFVPTVCCWYGLRLAGRFCSHVFRQVGTCTLRGRMLRALFLWPLFTPGIASPVFRWYSGLPLPALSILSLVLLSAATSFFTGYYVSPQGLQRWRRELSRNSDSGISNLDISSPAASFLQSTRGEEVKSCVNSSGNIASP